MIEGKVSLWRSLLGRLGLDKGIVLAQMLAHQLLEEGLVTGLGHDALLLEDGQDAHLLLDQLDGLDQVHTEIDESPLNTFGLVLLLLLDEHVVVEELLQTLISVVNEELLQDVKVENLEAGDVQDADEGFAGIGSVQRRIDLAMTRRERDENIDLRREYIG